MRRHGPGGDGRDHREIKPWGEGEKQIHSKAHRVVDICILTVSCCFFNTHAKISFKGRMLRHPRCPPTPSVTHSAQRHHTGQKTKLDLEGEMHLGQTVRIESEGREIGQKRGRRR